MDKKALIFDDDALAAAIEARKILRKMDGRNRNVKLLRDYIFIIVDVLNKAERTEETVDEK